MAENLIQPSELQATAMAIAHSLVTQIFHPRPTQNPQEAEQIVMQQSKLIRQAFEGLLPRLKAKAVDQH